MVAALLFELFILILLIVCKYLLVGSEKLKLFAGEFHYVLVVHRSLDPIFELFDVFLAIVYTLFENFLLFLKLIIFYNI